MKKRKQPPHPLAAFLQQQPRSKQKRKKQTGRQPLFQAKPFSFPPLITGMQTKQRKQRSPLPFFDMSQNGHKRKPLLEQIQHRGSLVGPASLQVTRRKKIRHPRMPPLGDHDGDGAINLLDCQPLNPFFQDFVSDKQRRWFFANIGKMGLTQEDWNKLSKKKKEEITEQIRQKQRKNPFQYIEGVEKNKVKTNPLTNMVATQNERKDLLIKDIKRLDKKHVTRTKIARDFAKHLNEQIEQNKAKPWVKEEYLTSKKGPGLFVFGVDKKEREKREQWLKRGLTGEDKKEKKEYFENIHDIFDKRYDPYKKDPITSKIIEKYPKYKPKVLIDEYIDDRQSGTIEELNVDYDPIELDDLAKTKSSLRRTLNDWYNDEARDYFNKHYESFLKDYALEREYSRDEMGEELYEKYYQPELKLISEKLPGPLLEEASERFDRIADPYRKNLSPDTDKLEESFKREAARDSALYHEIMDMVKKESPGRYKELKKKVGGR